VLIALTQEFNSTQRAAFCVFSGKGVTDLREYLTSLFKTITDNLQAPGIGAEYEGFDDNYHPGYMEDGDGDGDGYDLDDADGDADVEHEDTELHGYHFPGPAHFAGQSHFVEPMQPHQPVRVPSPNLMPPPQVNISTSGVTTAYGNTTMQPLPSPTETQRGGPSSIPTFTRRPGFGEVPFVEAPASPPPPSDAGSARSSGTNTSNGAGFFRNISARPLGPNGLPSPTRSMDGGSHTPDLIFAEIGHGRGIGHSHSHSGGAGPSSHRHAPYPPINGTHSLAGAVGHPMARNGYASYNTQAASGSSAMHHGNWPHRPSIDHAMSSGSSLPPENGPASSSSSFAVPTPPGQAMESQEIGSQDSRRSTKRTFRSAISSVFGRGDGTGRGGDGGARGF
jgi:F-box and leucine-rich repeat protein GRR1